MTSGQRLPAVVESRVLGGDGINDKEYKESKFSRGERAFHRNLDFAVEVLWMIAYETTRERVLVGCFLNWFIKYIVKSSNEKAQRETKILHESIANLVFCYRKL